MRRSLARIGAIAIVMIVGGGSAATVSAGTAGSQWGWVVVRVADPDPGPTYTPAPEDQGNSSGGVNTVTKTLCCTGRYLVTFGGLGEPVGIAHVSKFRGRERACSGEQPFEDAGAVHVFVNCFDRTPQANGADATFVVSYLSAQGQQVGSAALAYLYADPFDPPLVSYNSDGGTNQVTRLGFGDSRVTLGGMAGPGGHVQVSPWAGGVVCNVVSWRNDGDDKVVRVRCLSLAGVGQDVRFFLTFTREMGLKGSGGTRVAYLLANEPRTGAYTPPFESYYSSAGKVRPPRVTRDGVGRYRVKLPGMARGGAAHVTSFQGPMKRCVVADIRRDGLPQLVDVRCMWLGGTLTDSKFFLTYLK